MKILELLAMIAFVILMSIGFIENNIVAVVFWGLLAIILEVVDK